jgi:hypothetical protein
VSRGNRVSDPVISGCYHRINAETLRALRFTASWTKQGSVCLPAKVNRVDDRGVVC